MKYSTAIISGEGESNMDAGVFTMIGTFVSGLTAIIVALIGVRQNQMAKESEEYKCVKAELEEERQKKMDEQRKEEMEHLNDMKTSIKSVQKDVDCLKRDVETITQTKLPDITDQLANLRTLQGYDYSLTQSLSDVVTVYGEVLNESVALDESAKRAIHESIKNHQTIAHSIHEKLYNGAII